MSFSIERYKEESRKLPHVVQAEQVVGGNPLCNRLQFFHHEGARAYTLNNN